MIYDLQRYKEFTVHGTPASLGRTSLRYVPEPSYSKPNKSTKKRKEKSVSSVQPSAPSRPTTTLGAPAGFWSHLSGEECQDPMLVTQLSPSTKKPRPYCMLSLSLAPSPTPVPLSLWFRAPA